MTIFSFGKVSNSVNSVLTNTEKTASRDSYLYLAEDSVLANGKNLYITNPVKKNVLYPSIRGNVKMRNRIINNLLFAENASIAGFHMTSLNFRLQNY